MDRRIGQAMLSVRPERVRPNLLFLPRFTVEPEGLTWNTSAKTIDVTPQGVEALQHARFGATITGRAHVVAPS